MQEETVLEQKREFLTSMNLCKEQLAAFEKTKNFEKFEKA